MIIIRGFFDFIRQQGVVGLAIGFILGGAISDLVKSLVNDIIQPIIGSFIGSPETFSAWTLGPVRLGNFILLSINFVILAAIVYYVFKGLKLDRLDTKKEKVPSALPPEQPQPPQTKNAS